MDHEGYRSNLAQRLLVEAEERFGEDVIGFNSNSELVRTYEEALAYRDSEERINYDFSVPEYEGFDTDPELQSLPEDLKKIFGEDLLGACVISRFVNRSDLVNLLIGDKDIYITVEQYEQWMEDSPAVRDFKVRAENFTSWTPNFTGGVMPLPIAVYSFSGEDLDKFDYLDDVPESERMRLYKLGTVAHEVAHHILDYLLTSEEREELMQLCVNLEPLTPYAKKYKEQDHISLAGYANEQFCEAIRLFSTTPDYLKTKSPALDKWIRNTLPEVKSVQ